MKRIDFGLGVLALFAAGWASLVREEPHVLVIMGNTDGYLAPCGCTKPMTGGMGRRARAVRQLIAGGPATVLETGGLVSGNGRQDHLKADALAESLRHLGVTAAAITSRESALGTGFAEALQNLSGVLWVQSNLEPSGAAGIARFRESGPFLIGAASRNHVAISRVLGAASVSNDQAARDLASEAKDLGKAPILMLADGRDEARRLAREVPDLRLIVYRSAARPSATLERIGETLLASPGEKGKHVLRFAFREGRLGGYSAVEIGPEFTDDPAVGRVYRRYLAQVEREDLLGKLPREKGPRYAGTAACGSCHAKELAVWKGSEHGHALRTLIQDGHGRDPECVGCHVVGLANRNGFSSVAKSPQLANVGCESCHGPGAAHAAKPKVRMGKVGANSCRPCHVPDHSPGFDFASYWKRIRH